MNLPLQTDEGWLTGQCDFASERDLAAVRAWRRKHASLTDPAARDVLEFAKLAGKRWRYSGREGVRAHDAGELAGLVAREPQAEVSMVAVVRADWYRPSRALGVAHFRRTWFNHLVVDFLTTHLLIASRQGPTVKGVGTALLYFLACLAERVNVNAIWGETTNLSAPFYQRTLALQRVTDQFFIPRRQFTRFIRATESRWPHESLPAGGTGPSLST